MEYSVRIRLSAASLQCSVVTWLINAAHEGSTQVLCRWEICFPAINVDLGLMSSAMIISVPLFLSFTYNTWWSCALIAYFQTASPTEHCLCSNCDLKMKIKRFVSNTLKFNLNIRQLNKPKERGCGRVQFSLSHGWQCSKTMKQNGKWKTTDTKSPASSIL